jgi:ATPase subunit of ABC transporter with duplicated ATPase domains
MLTEVMAHFGLIKELRQAGYYETDGQKQLFKDLKVAVQSGSLVALTGTIGCGKTTTFYQAGEKPVTGAIVESVLSKQIDELEPKLTRHGYDVRGLAEQFNAKPAEIKLFFRGQLDAARTKELTDQMLMAGLPI